MHVDHGEYHALAKPIDSSHLQSYLSELPCLRMAAAYTTGLAEIGTPFASLLQSAIHTCMVANEAARLARPLP